MAWSRRAPRVLVLLGVLGLSACASAPAQSPDEATPVQRGPRVDFMFMALDGTPLSTESLAGRYSVLAFVTTYDTASQAQARFVARVMTKHVPRINAGALVLEPETNKPLVEAFAHTLELPYPVAIADAATIAGEGPFQGLHHVPSVLILDRQGHAAWVHLGLATAEQIEAALRAIEKGKAPPP